MVNKNKLKIISKILMINHQYNSQPNKLKIKLKLKLKQWSTISVENNN